MLKKLSSLCLLAVAAFASLQAKSVGIIGAGASGLTTAWLLDNDLDVTLYESQNRLGGNANSIIVNVNGNLVPIEAGFEFFAQILFPNYMNLLNILNVPTNNYTMTYTFYNTDGSDVLSLPPIHNGIIMWDAFTPNSVFEEIQFAYLIEAGNRLIAIKDVDITLKDFVEGLEVTEGFKNGFIYPFLAANWGVSFDCIKTFSAYDALKYVIRGKDAKDFEWTEVVGGTQTYIQALGKQIVNGDIKLSSVIAHVYWDGSQYTVVEADGTETTFDYLVIATNANQAAHLLSEIPESDDIRSILNQVEYFHTTIAIHGDARFMPPKRVDWEVVNVRNNGTQSAATIYKPWLSPNSPVFKSWLTFDVRAPDDQGSPIPDPLYALAYYEHPVSDTNYFNAQKAVGMIQGDRNLWFAGNWTWDNDSHESAIVSAIRAAQALAPLSSRLEQLTDLPN